MALVALAAIGLFGAGCAKKKVAAATPPAPQQTAATPRQTTAATPARSTPAPQQSASVTPRSNMPTAAEKARIDQLLARIEDAYFDYNQHTLRPDAIKALQSDSSELRDIISQYPAYKLVIEGHCDERGSEAYNMALGDARAKAAQEYLVGVGISPNQLNVISYGKDKPICEDHDEACWSKNRRIHIVATK
ncbi:MAG TPA: OmpA family protein [Candidatus Sulfopaludibacter sp.]|nr:OmpA family protein [Candidatus Sulfopaludibacter sp.]